MEEIFHKGSNIVDELINHSLLVKHDSVLRMKGLMKKMACNILKESDTNTVLKCNKYMRNIFGKREWSIDLASYIHSEIKRLKTFKDFFDSIMGFNLVPHH